MVDDAGSAWMGYCGVPRMAVTWSDLDEAILRRMFSEGATTKQVAEALVSDPKPR